MTFARYSRDLWTEEQAKVAKPAKGQENQEVGMASPWLKPAKVEARSPILSHTLAKLSPEKSAESLGFSRFSHISRGTSGHPVQSERPALVQAWLRGVQQLLAMSPPKTFPAHAWSSLIDDADGFMQRWADQAAGAFIVTLHGIASAGWGSCLPSTGKRSWLCSRMQP